MSSKVIKHWICKGGLIIAVLRFQSRHVVQLSSDVLSSPQEMGMRNPLHRKKLQLALNAFTSKVREKSSELDYIWVTRETLSSQTFVVMMQQPAALSSGLFLVCQAGWMTSACLSTRTSFTKLEWTVG